MQDHAIQDDYIKLLFSRAGHTISPISGREVKRESSEDVYNFCLHREEGEKVLILAPQTQKKYTSADWDLLLQKGYSRVWMNQETVSVQSLIDEGVSADTTLYIIVDRLTVRPSDEEFQSRMFDACETAFWEGEGNCSLYFSDKQEMVEFNNRFELDDIKFELPTKDFLSFRWLDQLTLTWGHHS